MKTRWRASKGFTLLELIVVVCIVALLATALLSRVWFYQEQAEKTAMVEVAGVIQSELLMRYGQMMIHGAEAQIPALATDNPMSWLAKAPRNYAGEFFASEPGALVPGSWVFDLKSHELIYTLDRTDFFVPASDGKKWIRYRVKLMYEPFPGVPAEAQKRLAGVLFEPVEPYKWLE